MVAATPLMLVLPSAMRPERVAGTILIALASSFAGGTWALQIRQGATTTASLAHPWRLWLARTTAALEPKWPGLIQMGFGGARDQSYRIIVIPL